MRRLGISLYPTVSGDKKADEEYIRLAGEYGFKRIFTNLLEIKGNKEDVINTFKKQISIANEYGMEVILDVTPREFETLGISYDNLSFFKEIGAAGLRLDEGFTGVEEANMTYNPYDLKVELNCSSGNKTIDNIMSYKPNVSNLIACHNFFPHRYTGLSYEHFEKTSKQYRDYNMKIAAFVSSNDATFGPWPVEEGIPTLESHRDLPITVQAKQLFYSGLVDDVIISNCYASKEEIEALSKLDKNIVTFDVELFDGITEAERKIALEEPHFNRGDVSEYMLRSTMSRLKYAGVDFPPFNTVDIKRGDVLIDNSKYQRYAGELHIALKEMKNEGNVNVIGRVREEELALLDYVGSWDKFKCQEYTK